MSKLRYTITYEVDKDICCDEETIRKDYSGSWQEWLDWFTQYERLEVLTGIGTDPLSIKVEL